MSPRQIEVHIEELVLHGFPPETRWAVAEALEAELQTLLAQRGIPFPWQSSPDRIDTRPIPASAQTQSQAIGAQIARAIHGGPTP
jgi:hypothetical protein